jgi:uncharacterized protein YqgC (DUF456 family)
MSITLAILVFLLLVIAFFTHIFSFPANWFIILILGAWSWITPESPLTLTTFLIFVAVAFLGECIEFALQALGASKYGASSSGNWGAFAGAIFGAILGAPFFLGLGALFGAVGGAYLGCLGVEVMNHRPFADAKKAALGAMIGKVLGLAVKIGIGIAFLVHAFDLLFLT